MPTFIHGKNTVIKVNAVDLSAYTDTTDFDDSIETEKVTCYGATRHAYGTGLGDGTITISGTHASDAAGPRKTLKTLKAAGTAVPFLFQPNGTGSGKAQSSVSVFVAKYKDSSPAAGFTKWTATLQMTGALDETDQT
jgi:hypothetical protein